MAEKHTKNTHPNSVRIPQFCPCLHPHSLGIPPLSSVFSLLFPVFCLLSPACPGVALGEAGCLLPIPPILPQPYFLCFLSVLGGGRPIMQNKPNSRTFKIATTSYTTRDYNNITLRTIRKNKPNLSRRSLWRSRNEPNLSRSSLRRSQNKPNCREGIKHPASSIQYRASSIDNPVSRIQYLVPQQSPRSRR